MSKKHYIYMNGSSGCMPDSLSSHDTLKSAIETALNIFGDSISEKEEKQLKRNLRVDGIHYFEDKAGAGADYCEVSVCRCGNPEEHNDI